MTVEANSMEEAIANATTNGRTIDSIEAVHSPGELEPSGPIPSSAPRPIPEQIFGAVEGKSMITFGVMFTAIPLVFFVVGVGMLIAGDLEGLFLIFVPIVHLSIGVFTIYNAVATRRRRTKLYVHGIEATAKIDRSLTTGVRSNKRPMYLFEWTFYVNDQPFHGKRRTMNQRALNYEEGDRIWILYDPSDPTHSVEWPPFL